MRCNSRYLEVALRFSQSWSWAVPPINWSDAYYQDDIYQKPIDVPTILNLSMDKDKMFHDCKFDSTKCNNNIRSSITETGPCYTFNNDGHIKTKETGTNSNLMIQFFIDQENYFLSFSDGSGIKVNLH